MTIPVQAEHFLCDNSRGTLHFSFQGECWQFGDKVDWMILEGFSNLSDSGISPGCHSLALSALRLPLVWVLVPTFKAQGKFLYPFFSRSQFSQPLSAPRLLLQISALTAFLSIPCFSKRSCSQGGSWDGALLLSPVIPPLECALI